MRIAVLVKEVPDTYGRRSLDVITGRVDRTGEAVIDEIDERALEAALGYRDTHPGTEVVAIFMAPAGASTSVRKALAMGATSAVHIVDERLGDSDLSMTAAVLAAALRRETYDLVIAGGESTDGRGGVLPAMIAEHLGLPHATFLDSLEIEEDSVRGTRAVAAGTAEVRATLPAIVSVTDRLPEARFASLKGILGAKKKSTTALSAADLGFGPDIAGGRRSVVVSVAPRAPRASGTTIVDEGDAGVRIADFLAAARVI